MPLVTRQANQGNVFNIATEPTDWQDGDLWIDVGQNPPILKLNDNGTARPCMWSGILAQGDITVANAANEMGRLALGTATQILDVNTGATALEYGGLLTPRGSFFSALTGHSNNETAFSQMGTTDFRNATESIVDIIISYGFEVNVVGCQVVVNSKNGASTMGFRDDGTTLGSTTITASTTGEFRTTGLTDAVASGSVCTFIIVTTASASGSINLGFYTHWSIV